MRRAEGRGQGPGVGEAQVFGERMERGPYFVEAAERPSFLDLSKPVRYKMQRCLGITPL